MDGFRRFFQGPGGRVLIGLTALAVGYAAGFGSALILRPERAVLPLPPQEFTAGEFLVAFHPGTPAQAIRNLHAEQNAEEIDEIPQIGVKKMRVPPGFSVGEMINRYKRNPNVEFAEPNYLGTTTQSVPNDPGYPSQYGPTKIQADGAWAISTGSSQVLIAVIDVGVSPTAADLRDKLTGSYNALTKTPGTSFVGNHGGAVSGVAGASSNNQTGIAGIAQANPIMPIRVALDTGQIDYYATAHAITYAADAGAKVLNLSVVFSSDSASALQKAVSYAFLQKGAVVVAATGNNDSSTPRYPAANQYVLAVGASTAADVRWVETPGVTGSNKGPHVAVVAPGHLIYTLNGDTAYANWTGTSVASPHVAGVAALMLSLNPALTNVDVVNMIKSTADPIPGTASEVGSGRVNALRALQAASGGPIPPTATPTTVASPTATDTPTATATVTATATTTATSTATPDIPSPTPAPPTSTATATATPTPTQTPLPTNTRTPTATRTSTLTATATPTPTPTATETATSTPTATSTATRTATPTPPPTKTPRPKRSA